MATFSRLKKIALFGTGVTGGLIAYYKFFDYQEAKYTVKNSWTTNYTPSVKWDSNWDHRKPTSLVKPSNGTADDENRFNSQLENVKPKAVRHLFLVRHGQYMVDGITDKERVLTELGRTQASLTGQRLSELNIKWDGLVRSTMTRARETAELVQKHLPEDLPIRDCSLLEEGAPVPPEPPVRHWKPEPKFFQDGARIEAAFRKYFHRAPPDQSKDSYTLLVCHANVIRYFICRVLQVPPEAWLRLSLNHGSITWVSINPNGGVVLRTFGDTGFMDPKYITSR